MKQIQGFPNYYITKSGEIYSKRRKGTKGGLQSSHKNNKGYYQIDLYKQGKRFHRLVHRLVLETYTYPCPSGMECRHLDGNPENNYVDNLCWGTRSENMQDAIKHGTIAKPWLNKFGENNPRSKLPNKERRLVIYQYLTGLFSQSELGRLYGISVYVVNKLVNGKTWPFVNVVEIRKAMG